MPMHLSFCLFIGFTIAEKIAEDYSYLDWAACNKKTNDCNACTQTGTTCLDDKGSKIEVLEPGYMTLEGGTNSTVYYCDNELRCPGGVPVGTFNCAPHHGGIACGLCDDGYHYILGDKMCKECNTASQVLCVVVILLFLVVAPWKLRPPEVEFGEKTIIHLVKYMFVTVPVLQLGDVLQLCFVWNGSSIAWPKAVNDMVSFIGGLFYFETLSIQCLQGGGDNRAANYVMFLFMLPLLTVAYLFSLSLPSALSACARKMRFPSPVLAANLTLAALIAFYISITNWSIAFVFAKYKHPSAHTSLVAFPYLLIDSDEVMAMQAMASLALTIWSFGTWLLIVVLLICVPKCKQRLSLRRSILMLTLRYRESRAWWTVIDITLKFFLVLAPVLTPESAEVRMYMIMCFLVYLIMLCFLAPYRFKRHTLSDAILSVLKILMLLAAESDAVIVVFILTYLVAISFIAWAVIDYISGTAADPEKDLGPFARFAPLFANCMKPLRKCLAPICVCCPCWTHQGILRELIQDCSPETENWLNSISEMKTGVAPSKEPSEVPPETIGEGSI